LERKHSCVCAAPSCWSLRAVERRPTPSSSRLSRSTARSARPGISGRRKRSSLLRLRPKGLDRYQRISLEPTEFHGYPAASWEFIVEEHGVLLRKTDVFFASDGGEMFAVLTQAPVNVYDDWAGVFDAVRDSLAVQED
jgi:hypothetical protein